MDSLYINECTDIIINKIYNNNNNNLLKFDRILLEEKLSPVPVSLRIILNYSNFIHEIIFLNFQLKNLNFIFKKI